MFKEQMNKFKSLFAKKAEEDSEKETKPNKRKIENLAFFLIVLIVTLIAINSIIGGGKKENTGSDENSSYKVLANEEQSEDGSTIDLEKRLEKILSTLSGVR